MLTLIEARNYRSLRYVRQPLRRFQVLTGPNAAGKTTFLDIPCFLSELISLGPEQAVRNRTDVFDEMTSGHIGDPFELAVESRIPEEKQEISGFNTIRYEVRVGKIVDSGQIGILAETAMLVDGSRGQPAGDFGELFPRNILPPESIFFEGRQRKLILKKNSKGNDNYYPEISKKKGSGGWVPSFKFGAQKSSLANLPDDGTRFPITGWFRDYLAHDVQRLVLDSLAMRQASAPGQSKGFKLDGSNLPWVVRRLILESKESFESWLGHLRTALPDLENIRTVEREDDKHLYFVIRYASGLEVPSWMVSDGTLRLLALTLPAYLPDLRGVLLIEEPENGVHPKAIETVIQSLSSVYNAQVLLATHSPVIINAIELEDILCFQKDDAGTTDIVSGTDHPALRDWKHETNLGVLFASGILG